jgi:hypothetical protein
VLLPLALSNRRCCAAAAAASSASRGMSSIAWRFSFSGPAPLKKRRNEPTRASKMFHNDSNDDDDDALGGMFVALSIYNKSVVLSYDAVAIQRKKYIYI